MQARSRSSVPTPMRLEAGSRRLSAWPPTSTYSGDRSSRSSSQSSAPVLSLPPPHRAQTTVVVADGTGNQITSYALGSGTPIRQIAGTATGISDASEVAADRSGNLYVANATGVRVTVYAANATGNVSSDSHDLRLGDGPSLAVRRRGRRHRSPVRLQHHRQHDHGVRGGRQRKRRTTRDDRRPGHRPARAAGHRARPRRTPLGP